MVEAEYRIYNVGQGLCTLLTGTLGDSSSFCGIFDCGSIAFSSNMRKQDIIFNMAEWAKRCGRINCIVISHQDVDHWSMLLDIILAFYGIESCELTRQGERYIKISSSMITMYQFEKNNINSFFRYIEKGYSYTLTYSTASENLINFFQYEGEFLQEDCIRKIHIKMDAKEICLEILENDRVVLNEEEQLDIALPVEQKCLKKLLTDISARWKEALGEFYHNVDAAFGAVKTNALNYETMRKRLCRETNIPSDEPHIGDVFLGGHYEDSYYQMLYEGLEILKQIHLIQNVYKQVTGYLGLDENVNPSCENLVARTELCGPGGTPRYEDIAILRNSTSIVTHFDLLNGVRIIMPGDATVHVFSSLAEGLLGAENYEKTLLVAPHHGSGNTNYCEVDEQPFITLLNKLTNEKRIPLWAVFISALEEIFGHPSQRFVKDVIPYCHTPGLDHKVYFGYENKKRGALITKAAVYATEALERQENFYWYYPQEDALANELSIDREREVLAGTHKRIPSVDSFI